MTYIEQKIEEVNKKRFQQLKRYCQHGDVSIYEHCVRVAYASEKLAEILHINVKSKELIRGALLHDYFFYDWHDSNNGRRLHGFTHPKEALNNASLDFELTDCESDIIRHHMFPLTPIPPMCREAWIVCLADKLCSLDETLFHRGNKEE